MTQQDLLGWTRRRPFAPFRLFVDDGSAFEIRHPELCMPGFSTVAIGLPRDPARPEADRIIMVSTQHVSRLEPIEATQAASN
jgi:hypothetical protein